MNNNFIHCLGAEWIKKRRSLASWLVIIGGFFIPLVNLLIFIFYPKQIIAMHESGHFWKLLFDNSWKPMAFMLLPMGIVLAVSLITQLEFKNNTWKQLHATPVLLANIYFSKLLVILVMMAQLFILFNIGIYLSAVFPSFVNSKIPFPNYVMDAGYLLNGNAMYFIASMPLVALQYLISLKFKNFLIPVGAGLVLVVGGLMALSWEYIFAVPTAYTALHFLQAKSSTVPQHYLVLWSVGYFIVFSLLGFWLYISKKEKG
jgi:hypothetical protein